MSLAGQVAHLNAVIGTEKDLEKTTVRLAGAEKKNADALRDWGTLEIGEDLHDSLSKIALLYDRFSAAETKYANEGLGEFRNCFRALRTSEEDYENLQKRKSQLAHKIESAEKELSKTPADHKDKATREQHLANMQSEHKQMEQTSMNEQARLSDLRRSTVQKAFGVQATAMLKYAESMRVVAEATQQLVAEIPQGQAQPGVSRMDYSGHAATTKAMEDAKERLDKLTI